MHESQTPQAKYFICGADSVVMSKRELVRSSPLARKAATWNVFFLFAFCQSYCVDRWKRIVTAWSRVNFQFRAVGGEAKKGQSNQGENCESQSRKIQNDGSQRQSSNDPAQHNSASEACSKSGDTRKWSEKVRFDRDKIRQAGFSGGRPMDFDSANHAIWGRKISTTKMSCVILFAIVSRIPIE